MRMTATFVAGRRPGDVIARAKDGRVILPARGWHPVAGESWTVEVQDCGRYLIARPIGRAADVVREALVRFVRAFISDRLRRVGAEPISIPSTADLAPAVRPEGRVVWADLPMTLGAGRMPDGRECAIWRLALELRWRADDPAAALAAALAEPDSAAIADVRIPCAACSVRPAEPGARECRECAAARDTSALEAAVQDELERLAAYVPEPEPPIGEITDAEYIGITADRDGVYSEWRVHGTCHHLAGGAKVFPPAAVVEPREWLAAPESHRRQAIVRRGGPSYVIAPPPTVCPRCREEHRGWESRAPWRREAMRLAERARRARVKDVVLRIIAEDPDPVDLEDAVRRALLEEEC